MGLTLGLFGGGGSILTVPLMVYVVGVPNPHPAISTSAFAVAANASASLAAHARFGNVKWRCAALYGFAGVVGAFAGSSSGKLVDGQLLLVLFALIVFLAGILMMRGKSSGGNPNARCSRENASKIMVFGVFTGSSLVVVMAFGLMTAVNYAASGLVETVPGVAAGTVQDEVPSSTSALR